MLRIIFLLWIGAQFAKLRKTKLCSENPVV